VADYLGLDPSLVRVTYLVITFFTLGVPGIILYLSMAFIIPLKPKGGGSRNRRRRPVRLLLTQGSSSHPALP